MTHKRNQESTRKFRHPRGTPQRRATMRRRAPGPQAGATAGPPATRGRGKGRGRGAGKRRGTGIRIGKEGGRREEGVKGCRYTEKKQTAAVKRERDNC